MLIVSGGEKGGTGKTALATNLAVCFALRGFDVVLVDSDPQTSSAKWAERRGQEPDLPSVRYQELQCRGDGEGYFNQLCDLRQRYQVVVVDVAGADSIAFRTAVACADRLYSPLIPSQCDTDTATSIDQVVAQVRSMGNRTLEARFVLNHCPTHARDDEVAEARAELAETCEFVACTEAQLAHRKAFRKAYKLRRGVVELVDHPDRDVRKLSQSAVDEVWRLFSEVSGDAQHEAAE